MNSFKLLLLIYALIVASLASATDDFNDDPASKSFKKPAGHRPAVKKIKLGKKRYPDGQIQAGPQGVAGDSLVVDPTHVKPLYEGPGHQSSKSSSSGSN